MDRHRSLFLGLAGASLGIGALVLLGWAFDVQSLLTILPGQVTMKANTAVCFALGGIALASLCYPRGARLRAACASRVLLVGGLTLLEYLLGRSLGIDEALFRDPIVGGGTSQAGRMAPNSAFNLCLVGIGLLLLGHRSRHASRIAQALAFLVLFITLLALLGYVYGAHVFVGLFSLNRMALHTVVGFVTVAGGILVATSDRAWLGELLRTPSARVVASRLLPAALLVPLSVGAAVLAGYRAGLYDAAFSTCLMTGAEVVSFSLLTWLSARALNAFEGEKASSRMDALTGLRSRRGFAIEAGEALDASRQAGHGALILFVDLDGMKRINDERGHAVGDAALIEMATLLRSIVRATDVVARLGGDEFVVLCAGAGEACGHEIVQRLSTRLDVLNALPGRPFRLECSAGFATTHAAERESLDDLLIRADAAMYQVKKRRSLSGRHAKHTVPETPDGAGAVAAAIRGRRSLHVVTALAGLGGGHAGADHGGPRVRSCARGMEQEPPSSYRESDPRRALPRR
jgi:diguanylate cyclase (GGDEF)-like protein